MSCRLSCSPPVVTSGQLHCAGTGDPCRSRRTSRALRGPGARSPRRDRASGWSRAARSAPSEGLVGHGAGLVPSEPPRLGTLAGRGCGVPVGRHQQVPQVEVGVPVGGVVDVDVDAGAGPRRDGRATRPVSSWDSRRAASHGPSPGSRWPPGCNHRCRRLCMWSTVPRRPTTTADPVTCTGPACSSKGLGRWRRSATMTRPGPRLTLVAGHVCIEGRQDVGRQPRGPASALGRSPDTSRHVPSLPHPAARSLHQRQTPGDLGATAGRSRPG